MELPISVESFRVNPATIAAAFERFSMLSEIFIFFGITLLETLVFLAGTFSFGIATHNARSFGGSQN